MCIKKGIFRNKTKKKQRRKLFGAKVFHNIQRKKDCVEKAAIKYDCYNSYKGFALGCWNCYLFYFKNILKFIR